MSVDRKEYVHYVRFEKVVTYGESLTVSEASYLFPRELEVGDLVRLSEAERWVVVARGVMLEDAAKNWIRYVIVQPAPRVSS